MQTNAQRSSTAGQAKEPSPLREKSRATISVNESDGIITDQNESSQTIDMKGETSISDLEKPNQQSVLATPFSKQMR